MADAGVKMGLPRDLAYQLAAQTMVIGFEKTLKYWFHEKKDCIEFWFSRFFYLFL